MAKQNLIAGGYIGKMGDTIGQSWKNKRIIKAYGIPSNPRTEKQQSNRQQFKTAVELSQLAMAFNRLSPIWKYNSKTEYQNRMSECLQNLKNGLEGYKAMPLYPLGTIPTVILDDIKFEKLDNGKIAIKSQKLASLENNRVFTIMYQLKEKANNQLANFFVSRLVHKGSTELLQFEVSTQYEIAETSIVMAITKDDKNHDSKFIYAPPQLLPYSEDIIIDDMILTYKDSEYIQFTSDKLRGYIGNYEISAKINAISIESGVQTVINEVVQINLATTDTIDIPLSKSYSLVGTNTIEILSSPILGTTRKIVFTQTEYTMPKRPVLAVAMTATSQSSSPFSKEITVQIVTDLRMETPTLSNSRLFTFYDKYGDEYNPLQEEITGLAIEGLGSQITYTVKTTNGLVNLPNVKIQEIPKLENAYTIASLILKTPTSNQSSKIQMLDRSDVEDTSMGGRIITDFFPMVDKDGQYTVVYSKNLKRNNGDIVALDEAIYTTSMSFSGLPVGIIIPFLYADMPTNLLLSKEDDPLLSDKIIICQDYGFTKLVPNFDDFFFMSIDQKDPMPYIGIYTQHNTTYLSFPMEFYASVRANYIAYTDVTCYWNGADTVSEEPFPAESGTRFDMMPRGEVDGLTMDYKELDENCHVVYTYIIQDGFFAGTYRSRNLRMEQG